MVNRGNIWFTAGCHDFKLYSVLYFVYQYFRQLVEYGVRSVEIELDSTFGESKIDEGQKYKILKRGLKINHIICSIWYAMYHMLFKNITYII